MNMEHLNAPNSLNSTSESQSSIQQHQNLQNQDNCGKSNINNDKLIRNINCINEERLQQSKNQENLKRKKSKLRNSTIPPSNPSNSYYPKELDTWLENCIKDINTPQLSSSSEFLDYNTSSFTSNKNLQQNQIFNKPTITTTQGNKFNIGGFQKNDMLNLMNNPFDVNKMFRNLNHITPNDSPGEFASLPPIVNFGPNGDTNCPENFDPNDPSRSFRFSDPCLVGVSDNESNKMSEQNITDNNRTNNDTNKFLTTLLEQINILHETNSKICRNLHETKVEIEALKHTSSWGGGLRHRRDSLSGLSTHSQPMGFGFGNQSPAPTYHSGVYTPGMMTDVVREVKEAARVREEALLSRVKAMVEERSWSIGEGNIRLMRDIEEMKAQIQHLKSDRRETNKRITQLEAENKYLKSILISMLNNKTLEIINENENVRTNSLRKNYMMTESPSSASSINLTRQKRNDINNVQQHGILNQSGDNNTTFQEVLSINERNHQQKPVPPPPPPLTSSSTTLFDMNNKLSSNHSNYERKNTSLTDSLSSSSATAYSQNNSPNYNRNSRTIELYTTTPSDNERNNITTTTPTTTTTASINNDGTTAEDQNNLMQYEKDNLELRRELHEALASKKQVENRVIALENMVKNLQIKITHTDTDRNTSNNFIQNGLNTSGIMGIYENNNNMSQNNLSSSTNQGQYASQMHVISSKLSLAGPITDL